MLSTRSGKRQTALVGLSIALFGVCLMPFLLVPARPYLIMIEWIILAFGIPCANLMFSSMIADICDEDELVTGLRREGAYVAVGGFFGKTAQVGTLLLAGALPRIVGYTDTSVPPELTQLELMRAMLIGINSSRLSAPKFSGLSATLGSRNHPTSTGRTQARAPKG